VPSPGPKVSFLSPDEAGSLCGEQFWGRAVRASCGSNEPRDASYFWAKLEAVSIYPVREGNFHADPSRNMVPTTML
jgi:hypothetical protein